MKSQTTLWIYGLAKSSDKAFVLCDFYHFLDFNDVNNSIRVRGQKHLFHAHIPIVVGKKCTYINKRKVKRTYARTR